MELPKDASLLRVFVDEAERLNGRPTYEAIVMKARELHLAGATVLRGIMGFGKTSRIHSAKVLEMSFNLPAVIEIVDTEEKLNTLIPLLGDMIKAGLVTLEKAQVIHYKHEGEKK